MEIIDFLMNILLFAGATAVAIVGGIIAAIVYGVRHVYYAITGRDYVPLLGKGKEQSYQHQDVLEGATADSMTSVLKDYARLGIVGKYARAGIDALESEKAKNANFFAVLDTKFERTSLSWQKFAGAADATHDAVLRNCAVLTNRIQIFNRDEYRRASRARRSSSYRLQSGAEFDSAQKEKLQLMESNLADMDSIIASNESLLLELDKLTVELGKLVDTDATADSDRLVEEIRTLIDQAKYYGD